MTDTEKDVVAFLEDLVIRSEEFRKLEGELSYFCPFEAMGMTDQEIWHAHFLSYILDPNRPHGFEDAYLRAFLNVAAEKGLGQNSYLRPIDVHLLDLNDVQIVREKERVDLRIELPASRTTSNKPVVLIFELKINASESKDQLETYVAKMRAEYLKSEVLFFYLTKNGDDPSEDNKESWIALSLRDIVSRFENVNAQKIGREDARETVRAYLSMMRRNHMSDQDDKLDNLARDLWSKHKEALEFLVRAQPDDVSDILADLFAKQDNFCASINIATEMSFKPDQQSNPRTIILFPDEFDHINKEDDGRRLFVLVIDRNYGDRDKIRFRWLIRPGNIEKRRLIYEAIAGKKRAFSNDWTQIAVQRQSIGPTTVVEDIQKAAVKFVSDQKSRMAGLHASKWTEMR